MIPDLAIIVAVYACARLLGAALSSGANRSGRSETAARKFDIANVLNLVAVGVIIYFTYHIVQLGANATSELSRIHLGG